MISFALAVLSFSSGDIAAPSKNIVQLAQSVPTLSTLVTAVVAANLTSTLSSPGPFTVLAPNNDAFSKVPSDVLKRLLEPKHIKELQEVLELHVAAGNVQSKDLKNEQKIKTVNNLELEVFIKDGKVLFFVIGKDGKVVIDDFATVIAADNEASNGVVHIIDTVLLPDTKPSGGACKASEYCCPDAKKCLTPTSTSCKNDANACSKGEVCCPLTKICVKPGADCSSPCADQNSYCCPDAKHCVTPTDAGVFCSKTNPCKHASDVCCPLTNLCVSVGAACTPS